MPLGYYNALCSLSLIRICFEIVSIGHEWSFAKLAIEDIMLLDFYGGVKHVNVKDYYNATPY